MLLIKVALLSVYMSIWLTVTFTVERYVAVCHPMRGRLLCTEQRAKRAVLIIAVLALITTSTVPWEYKVDAGKECVRTEWSELGSNQLYRQLFYWFNAVVFTVTPLVLLAIFNCFLVSFETSLVTIVCLKLVLMGGGALLGLYSNIFCGRIRFTAKKKRAPFFSIFLFRRLI